MPRIQLTPLPTYRFSYATSVRVTDMNYGAHLGNDSVVSLLQEGKARLFKTLGMKETDMGDGKTGYVMGDLVVNYLKEAFAFEDVLIETDIDEIGIKSFRFCQRIRRGSEIIALSESGCVCFDFKCRKSAPLPPSFLKLISTV